MVDAAQPVLIALVLAPALHGLSASPSETPGMGRLDSTNAASVWGNLAGDQSRGQLAQRSAACEVDSLRCRLENIAPRSPQNLIWVRAMRSVALEALASELAIDETRLARLNQVNEDHIFDKGEWIALPSSDPTTFSSVASLDMSVLRSVPPPQVRGSSLTGLGVIHLGDTLSDIARRYGLTIAELLRLNPGLETSRLTVGSRVRLAQSAPVPPSRSVLGLNPVGSGDSSWPEAPVFSRPASAELSRTPASQVSFYGSLDDLVRREALLPSEHLRPIRIPALPVHARSRDLCVSGALSNRECRPYLVRHSLVPSFRYPSPSPLAPISVPASALLSGAGGDFRLTNGFDRGSNSSVRQSVQAPRPALPRSFGGCTYRWDGWRLGKNGVRTTTYDCGKSGEARYVVGVSCDRLKLNQYKPLNPYAALSGRWAWGQWRDPEVGGEEQMVAALCANLVSAI